MAASLALLVLTIAVNLMANFVAPIYALTNLFPRKLNFSPRRLRQRRSSAWSSCPGTCTTARSVIVYFLGGLGALLGPLFGVIIADYWLLRRTKINVPELYTEDPHRRLTTTATASTHGPSRAFIPAAIISLLIAFIPALHSRLGVLLVLRRRHRCPDSTSLVADRKQTFEDVSGEPIAIPSVH